VRPARILADVAADRARLLARRIGGIEQSVLHARVRQVDVDQAGLHARVAVLDVELEHIAHARETDHDAAGDGSCSTGKPRPRAAADDGDLLAMQHAHHSRGFVGGARQQDELGLLLEHREPVRLVRKDQRRPIDEPARPDDRSQLVDDLRVHAARPWVRSRCVRASTTRARASRA
jgi:hypothetical protein